MFATGDAKLNAILFWYGRSYGDISSPGEGWKCGDARDKLEPGRWDAWRGRWTLCGCAMRRHSSPPALSRFTHLYEL
jgi:hypothetical protein